VHVKRVEDFDLKGVLLKGVGTVILVDLVMSSGKSVVEFVEYRPGLGF